MKVMRLIVPSTIPYTLKTLSNTIGVKFDDRMVVDVQLLSEDQVNAAKKLEKMFAEQNMSAVLRNGPNAVAVYSATVIDIP